MKHKTYYQPEPGEKGPLQLPGWVIITIPLVLIVLGVVVALIQGPQ